MTDTDRLSLRQRPINVFQRQHAIHGGPVTCATIRFPPPSEGVILHPLDGCASQDEYNRLKLQGRVVLSRGGWIESHPLCSFRDGIGEHAADASAAVYKTLAFGKSTNATSESVSGMLFPSSLPSLSWMNGSSSSTRVPLPVSVVAYGGRKLNFLTGGGLWSTNTNTVDSASKDEFEFIPIITTCIDNDGHFSTDCVELSDWVHSASLLNLSRKSSPEKQQSNEDIGFSFLLALGMVNNNCEIWSFSSTVINVTPKKEQIALEAKRLQYISCDVRCMTYSLSFYGWQDYMTNNYSEIPCLLAASGTVFGEIIVWCVVSEAKNDGALKKAMDQCLSGQITLGTKTPRLVVSPSFRLKGHHGSVFSVKFGPSGEIASTSDDRTVRLWALSSTSFEDKDCKLAQSANQILDSHSTQSYTLMWTGWGHTARVWDVSFACPSIHSVQYNSTVIVSAGEDGLIRVWSPFITDKEFRRPLRGHRCESVWTVDFCEGIVVTGANDGSVKLFDLDNHLGDHGAKTYTVPLVDPSTESDLYTKYKPETENTLNVTKKKKRKKIKTKSRVIDMEFLGSNLLIAARDGSLISLNATTGCWKTHKKWSNNVITCASGEVFDVDPTLGSCIAVCPSGDRVIIGTTDGLLISSELSDDTATSARNVALNVASHQSIQSISWQDNTTLVAFHSKGTIICYVFEEGMPKLMQAMRLDTAGIPLSFACDINRESLYIGDSRGNLAYLSLNSFRTVFSDTGKDDISEKAPNSILARVHAKEHVTGIVVSTRTEDILSVGNDGCVHQCRKDSDGELYKVFTIPVPNMTGLRCLWLVENSIIVGGYYGNDFAVVNIEDGYEYMNVPTGGRQRRTELVIHSPNAMSSFPMSYAMAVCTGHDLIDIHLQGNFEDRDLQYPSVIGYTFHGETINRLCWVKCKRLCDYRYLLSGSNDCTVKLSKFTNNGIVSVKELPPHESCVRGVCSSSHPKSDSTLLVSCGGKLSIEFYLLHHKSRGEMNIDVSFLCSYRTLVTATIDHRMNMVTALPLLANKAASHLVVAADSDGDMHVIVITEEPYHRRTTIGNIIQGSGRPIICLDLMQCMGDKILAFTGNTAGEIMVWDLSMFSSNQDDRKTKATPSLLLTFKSHSSGVNDLSVLVSGQTESRVQVIMCSVGDDQMLSASSFTLTHNSLQEDGSIKLSDSEIVHSQCSSASPLKAVKIVNDNSLPFCRVYTSGSAELISLWHIDLQQLAIDFISSSSTSIEGSCIDCMQVINSNGVEQELIAVGGEGVELQSVNLSTIKAAKRLFDANFLLITAGAGFSADSGLSTYECAPAEYKTLCDPSQLMTNANRFQQFWLDFSHTYRNTKPHTGYQLMNQWCSGGLLPNLARINDISSWWVYTSNVDGHFRLFDSFNDTVCEIHGSAGDFICSSRIGYSDGSPRLGKEWEQWNKKASACRHDSSSLSRLRISDDTIENGMLLCENCQLPLRPNVLMFNDTDEHVLKGISIQRHKYQTWESQVEDAISHQSSNLVILELGCGTTVPAVRQESEEVLLDCSCLIECQPENSKGSVCLIRINPKDSEVNATKSLDEAISIQASAKEALEEIDFWLKQISATLTR